MALPSKRLTKKMMSKKEAEESNDLMHSDAELAAALQFYVDRQELNKATNSIINEETTTKKTLNSKISIEYLGTKVQEWLINHQHTDFIFNLSQWKQVRISSTPAFSMTLVKMDLNLEPLAQITLDLQQFRSLLLCLPEMELALEKTNTTGVPVKQTSVDLSQNVYMCAGPKFNLMDIRFWFIDTQAELRPTRKGVTIHLSELRLLHFIMKNVNAALEL